MIDMTSAGPAETFAELDRMRAEILSEGGFLCFEFFGEEAVSDGGRFFAVDRELGVAGLGLGDQGYALLIDRDDGRQVDGLKPFSSVEYDQVGFAAMHCLDGERPLEEMILGSLTLGDDLVRIDLGQRSFHIMTEDWVRAGVRVGLI